MATKKSEDKKSEGKKADKKEGVLGLSHELTHDQALMAVAPRLLKGGDLHGSEEGSVLAQLCGYYKIDAQYAATKIEQEQSRLIAEEQAKDAVAAAEKATEEAKAKTLEAQRLAAEAEGKVVVNVPKRFQLQTAPGKFELIKPGSQVMPLEWAQHPYSVANGVTIVGSAAAKK